MGPPDPSLAAANHPVLVALLWATAGVYALGLLVALVRPAAGRWVVAGGVALHLVTTTGRGLAIDFFPLTNKMESFNACALAIGLVAVLAWRPSRAYLVPLLAVGGAALSAALVFPGDLRWPPPLMRTIWYPLHIPLSFLAYGCWSAAAAASVAWGAHRAPAWVALADKLALWGFGLWSLSMVTGGVWGVVAWGAWFMWDPKVMWSVILWFHYAAFVHLRLTPSLQGRAWVRPALAIVGFVFVLTAYVGTSFFFGRSSHAFG